jgi:hypothetical protein
VSRKALPSDLTQLAIDIYNRNIDGVPTAWVADHYGISHSRVLKALKGVVKGDVYAPDYPFGEYCDNMCGVAVADGSTFTYGDDADFGEGRRGAANHYIWFCN